MANIPNPRDLVFGSDGNLYVTVPGWSAVMLYNGTTGAFIQQFATAGGLNYAFGLTFGTGTDTNLYVANGSGVTGHSAGSSILRYLANTGAFDRVFASGGGVDGPTFIVFGA